MRGVVNSMDNCLSPIEYVKQSLGARDVLEALAEECCELAQAAIKTIRSAEGSNPTPISYDACYEKLTEEVNDVLMVLTLIGKVPEYVTQNNPKWDRWANRIANRTVTAKNEAGGDT